MRARVPAVRALGHRRHVAGPDAARPRPPSPGVNELLIVDGPARPPPTWACTRVSLNFAAFRSALERGRAARRRPGAAGLAAGAAVRLALVPDREPLPLQRQVPAAPGSRGSSSTRTRATCRGSGMAALEAEAFLIWPSLRLAAARVARREHGLPSSWASSTSPPTRSATAASGSSRRPRSRTAWSCSPRAPTSSTSAASRPGRVPSGRPGRGGAAPGAAGGRASSPRAGVAVTVDTMRAEVAAAALEAGARARQRRQRRPGRPRAWPRLVADAGVPYVAMHWRGAQHRHAARGVVRRRRRRRARELTERVEAAVAAGVSARADRARPRLRVRQAAPSTTGGCCAASTELVGARAPGARRGRRARRSSAAAGADRTATPRRRGARRRHARDHRAGRRGRASWGVRVHDVPATVDAVEVAAAWASGGEADDASREAADDADRIELRGLRARGRHGVLAHEKRAGPGLRRRRRPCTSTLRAAAAHRRPDRHRRLRRAGGGRRRRRRRASRST